MNYIYLDTRIVGAVEQLIEYFNTKVFNKSQFLVFFKSYKKEKNIFSKMLNKNGIMHHAFSKFSEINMAEGSVVFYLFNAQSNCRIVANRKLIHIFVTHGESNKVSSVKPIIRIYDYIAVAGKLGIQRYLHHKIFHTDDVLRHKLIMMGNTFVGQNNFSFDAKSNAVLYAPTWEGGVPEENYSSLEWDNIFIKLADYLCAIPDIKLYIQPHPNLGHRNSSYQTRLYFGIKYLIKRGIRVVLIKNKRSIKDNVLQYCLSNFSVISKNTPILVQEAFCDISAMETQFYTKRIPTRIFLKNENQIDPRVFQHYTTYGITENDTISFENSFDESYYHYLLGYQTKLLENTPLNNRVTQMIEFIKNCNLHY